MQRRVDVLRAADSEIPERAFIVFESASGAASWLIRPTNALVGLDGKAPVDVMGSPKGRDVVLQLLLRIDYGIPP